MTFLLYYRVHSQYEAKDRRQRAWHAEHYCTRFKSQIILLDKAKSSLGRLCTQTDRTVPDAAHRHYIKSKSKMLNSCRMSCISVIRKYQFGPVYVFLNLDKCMNFVSWCKLINTRNTIFWKLQANTLQPVTLKRLDSFSFFGCPTENSVSFRTSSQIWLWLLESIQIKLTVGWFGHLWWIFKSSSLMLRCPSASENFNSWVSCLGFWSLPRIDMTVFQSTGQNNHNWGQLKDMMPHSIASDLTVMQIDAKMAFSLTPSCKISAFSLLIVFTYR